MTGVMLIRAFLDQRDGVFVNLVKVIGRVERFQLDVAIFALGFRRAKDRGEMEVRFAV